jgi:antitoxin VapB
MSKQFNIRSETAQDTARRLAKRLGRSTASVVEIALDRLDRETFEAPAYEDLTPEQKARADRLLALGREARAEGNRVATSAHDWLYDENGLPK